MIKILEDNILQWTFDLNGLCGYINIVEVSDDIDYDIQTERSCQKKEYGHICKCTDGVSCEDGIHVEKNYLTWNAANETCTLIKVNHESFTSIYNAINDRDAYWIGLRRFRYIGWVGRDGSIDVPDTDSNGCVWAERLGNGSVVFGIIGCKRKYKPVCTEDAISNKISTSYSTSDQTPVPSTARNTENYSKSLSDTQTQPDGAVIGGSGAAAVVVILVLVLLAMIWMKRRKRVCFKDKSPDPDTRHVTSNQNVYELSDDHNVDSDYCDINDRPDEADADSLNNRNGRQHYEFEQGSAEPQLGVSGAKDEPYELAMDPRKVNADGEGDYDELHDSSHNKGEQWSGADIYSHIHGGDGRGRYDPYDRTTSVKDMSPPDATYSHIHSNRGVDDADTYDSAAPVEVVSTLDTTYSYVVPSTLGNE
ncbi:uncharacterized protein LOC121385108 [Gigantopelta aegis]|uniref:uncharacterized protein LOC121385108 n=1 Tax=Gigantopelta aegis TaxID=1735272 RepID=UPI001B887F22|nr:uncharacterized protein LOC121385108 [Gigantopelta aegis]